MMETNLGRVAGKPILLLLILVIGTVFAIVPVGSSIGGEVSITYGYNSETNTDNTITVTRLTGSPVVTLVDVVADPDISPSILREESPGVWYLGANLFLDKGVGMLLTNATVTWLKMKSDPGLTGFVWFKSYSGNVLIENTRITSWDSTAGNYDTNPKDGRSYILSKFDSRMDIISSELSYLGCPVSPCGGESYGVSWRDPEPSSLSGMVTGNVVNSTFSYNYYGAYTFGAKNMIFRGNDFHHNWVYGLDPHDDSNYFLVEENLFHDNGKQDPDPAKWFGHGLVFSKSCVGNTIRNNLSYDNNNSGIMLDRSSNDNVVENNEAFGNGIRIDAAGNMVHTAGAGIAIYASGNNIIRNNVLHHNDRGVMSKQSLSTGNLVQSNSIFSNFEYGVYFFESANGNTVRLNEFYSNTKTGVYLKTSRNIVEGNLIQDQPTGVHLYTSSAKYNVVRNNTILNSSTYGIRIQSASYSTVEGNRVVNGGEAVRIDGAIQNRFVQNILQGNAKNYYYLKNGATSNVVLDEANVTAKFEDSSSTLAVISSVNQVYKARPSLVNVASQNETRVFVKKATSISGIVTLNLVELTIEPALESLNATITTWETGVFPFPSSREWLVATSVAANATYIVGGLQPTTEYRVEVNQELYQTLTADETGRISFNYQVSGTATFKVS